MFLGTCDQLIESCIFKFQCYGVMGNDLIEMSEEQLLVFCLKLSGKCGIRNYGLGGCRWQEAFWYCLECHDVVLVLQCLSYPVSGSEMLLVF